jgi:hypothetical protein
MGAILSRGSATTNALSKGFVVFPTEFLSYSNKVQLKMIITSGRAPRIICTSIYNTGATKEVEVSSIMMGDGSKYDSMSFWSRFYPNIRKSSGAGISLEKVINPIWSSISGMGQMRITYSELGIFIDGAGHSPGFRISAREGTMDYGSPFTDQEWDQVYSTPLVESSSSSSSNGGIIIGALAVALLFFALRAPNKKEESPQRSSIN